MSPLSDDFPVEILPPSITFFLDAPDEYIFVRKDNWRRIDVSNLGKRLDGTLQEDPYIEFNDKHKGITFFLAPESKREKGGGFEGFLGVFLDDLLKSVSVEK